MSKIEKTDRTKYIYISRDGSMVRYFTARPVWSIKYHSWVCVQPKHFISYGWYETFKLYFPHLILNKDTCYKAKLTTSPSSTTLKFSKWLMYKDHKPQSK